MKVIPKDQPLYFNAHELTDIDFVPVNCFEPIQRGQGIKTENISRLRYGILDFDPIHNTEVVNGEIVKRNLTKEENQQIVKEVDAVRMELLEKYGPWLLNEDYVAFSSLVIPKRKISTSHMAT